MLLLLHILLFLPLLVLLVGLLAAETKRNRT